MGAVIIQIFTLLYPVYKEIVERTVGNKFQCTERVRYTFKVVTLSVSEVIHRIGLPRCTSTVMRMVHYAIDDRIAEVHIRVCHINLGTKHHSAFCYFTRIHFLEQGEAFLYRTVTVRAFYTRLGRSAFLLCYLFRSLLVDICFTFFNKADGKVP